MESIQNREYMIFQLSEINNIDFSQVMEQSSSTLRKSVDQLKSFVKWEGDTVPSSINSLSTKEGPYTYEQILSILSGPEWTDPNPNPRIN